MNSERSIGVIRESRLDENRTPLVPQHIGKIKSKFPNLNIFIQPSKNRCFSDEEYKNSGADIKEDLTNCSIIFGVKEIDAKILIKDKTYVFFSHTYKLNKETLNNAQGTPGMDKKELLKSILEKKIKLIDYENIRDKNSKRYLGFGRFAGIVGCYNTLNLCLENYNKQPLARAYKINNYERLISNLKNLYFPKMKILVTGDGRVAKGVIEVLKETNIKEVSKEVFKNNDFDIPIFCNLETKDYVQTNLIKKFDLNHFIENPKEYTSTAFEYLKSTNILISAHYWDPASPKIFEKNHLSKLTDLRVIGDITCDVDGSIPTTIRSSTIENPNFYIDKNNFEEIQNKKGLAIMAVDNLPSELPRDSSKEFGDGIVSEVIPYLFDNDDGRILNATITSNGSFLKKYKYLNDYISSP